MFYTFYFPDLYVENFISKKWNVFFFLFFCYDESTSITKRLVL